MISLYSAEYGSYVKCIIYAIYFYIYIYKIYPQWCHSSLSSTQKILHKKPIIRIYILHKNNIAVSVEQVALTLETALGTGPQLFPCCSRAETDCSVCVLAKGLDDYGGTNISAQFNSLA